MNTWDNNKDVQILKEELWTRRTTAEIMMLWRNKIIGETNLLEEIQWNRTKKKEVVQELTGKFKNKFYEKTIIL